MTQTTPTPTVVPVNTDSGDHDRFSHIVNKAQGTQAYIEGTPIKAICGKVWVPSADPSRFPICPSCAEIFERHTGKKWPR